MGTAAVAPSFLLARLVVAGTGGRWWCNDGGGLASGPPDLAASPVLQGAPSWLAGDGDGDGEASSGQCPSCPCIGRPVADTRWWARRGKVSRLLARMLAPAELRQVMHAERGCAANQVRPGVILVNGRSLSQGKLDLLLGCPVSPEHSCSETGQRSVRRLQNVTTGMRASGPQDLVALVSIGGWSPNQSVPQPAIILNPSFSCRRRRWRRQLRHFVEPEFLITEVMVSLLPFGRVSSIREPEFLSIEN
uniref:Uncharacterized protein n=1 Tax=Oryza glumipatula TaxID=40148 RepID=A0A0E0B1N3_9ORYZ